MTQNINAEAARNGRVIQANSNSALKDNLLNTVLRRLTLAWPLVIFLLLPALTRAETAVQAWVQRYNGPGNGNDQATAIAVDGSNNIIVTGYSGDSGGGEDYATIKYSSAGVPLWTNRYNGPANADDLAKALAVDHSGNVIVAGHSMGSGSDYDFATVKYIPVPSPVLTPLQLTGGSFQMRVDDVLQPGTLVIQASENLTAWAPVFTNTTPTNVLFYTDPAARNYPGRFYRAFQSP